MSSRPAAVLLRAVNLAGNRLSMTDFKAVLGRLGFEGARTLGASGNAVISAPAADEALELAIERALAQSLPFAPQVFVRDGHALSAVLAANPFIESARNEPQRLAVMFLKGEPRRTDVELLQARIAGPEEAAAGPACLYVRYPEGMGRSKLTGATIERALKLSGTVRNWNTVAKLAAMLAES